MSSSSWNSVVLGAPGVAVISSGGTPSRTNPEYFNGDVSWVKSGDLNDSTVYHTDECISQKGLALSAARILPKGTVLVAMYGATVGKTAILGTLAATNQAVCSIQPNRDQFNARFLQFLLMHYRPTLLKERYGGAQPNISQTIIRTLKLPQPSIAEQQKIAAVLWKLQRAIATQDKLLKATADLKASAMQRLFTHGLRGEPLKDTEIGPMPESWEVATIGDVAKISAGGTPSRSNPEFWSGGTIPWVKTGEIDYGVITDTEEKITSAGLKNSAAKMLPKGTLLVAMYGQGVTRGKVAILGIEAATNQACAAIRTDEEKVCTDFLYHVLAHGYERLRGLAHGGQQQNLNADLIRGFVFGHPSDTDEQRAIAAALATLDRKLAHHRAKRAALHDLFQTLLHQLMTAQVRVADLDIDVSEVTDHLDDADKKMVGKPATATGAQLPTSKSVERTGKR